MRPSSSGSSDARFPIPVRLNACLGAVHLLISGFVLFGLPCFAGRLAAFTAIAACALALTINPLWALLHEAIHGILQPSQRHNELWGRALAIVAYGAPFHVISAGHLVHHKTNGRTSSEQDLRYPNGQRLVGRALAAYYCNLFFDPYLLAFAGNLAALLPKSLIRLIFKNNQTVSLLLAKPKAFRCLRFDAVAIVSLYSLSLWLYAPKWWVVALVTTVRCLAISFLDDIYHTKCRRGDPLQGSELRLPRAVSRLLLNFNLHGVHHRHPRLPWNALPQRFENSERSYDGGYLTRALGQLLPNSWFGASAELRNAQQLEEPAREALATIEAQTCEIFGAE